MPTYKYRAITEKGVVVEGVTPAESRGALREELSRKGLLPSDIRRSLLSTVAKVKGDDLLFFTRELTALVRAGIPIPEALEVITEQSGRSPLRSILSQVHTDVSNGAPLSEALVQHKTLFDPLFPALIRIGERSGELDSALAHYQKLFERKLALKRKVTQALAYPVFILSLTIVMVAILFFYSLPRFMDLYAELGSDLPGATKMLLNIVDWLADYGWTALAVGVVVFAAIRHWSPPQSVRLLYEKILGYLPFYGEIRNCYSLSLCCHALYSLLASGMTLVDAIRYVAGVVPGLRLPMALTRASDRIHHGAGLLAALRMQNIFSPSALKLIAAGEKSGTVAAQLREMAHYYDRRLDYRMSTMVALFEPLLILVTGLIVGAAVVAMYLPMFGLTGAL